MIGNATKRGLCKSCSASYVEKFDFSTCQFGVKFIHYELKISIRGFIVENSKSQIPPKGVPSFDGKMVDNIFLNCCSAVLGKNYVGFSIVDPLSIVIAKIIHKIHDTLIIFTISFRKKG